MSDLNTGKPDLPKDGRRTHPSLWRRILGDTRGMRRRIAGTVGLVLLGTPLMLLTPVPLKVAVDNVIPGKPLSGFLGRVVPSWFDHSPDRLLALVVVLQVGIVFLLQVQEAASTLAQTSLREQFNLAQRGRLLDHVQRMSFGFHDRRGTADSIFRIQYDADGLGHVIVSSLIPFIGAAVTLVSMFVVIVRVDLLLALIALAIVPPLFVAGRVYSIRMDARYEEVMDLESSALDTVQEILTSFRVVKAFGRERDQTNRFLARSKEGARQRVWLTFKEGLFGTVVSLTTGAGAALVLFAGVLGVRDGRLTVGELLVVIAYLAELYGPLETLSHEITGLRGYLANVRRVYEVLDEQPEVTERPDARPLRECRGEIVFNDVSFGYPGRGEVLRHISLHVPAGTRLGIAGRTGVGKTTLVSLLNRFYDPTAGFITLDGVDLRELQLTSLRSQFAIVLQDPMLFSTSIRENIRFADPSATESRVRRAAELAGAAEFIEALPEGYETLSGERGMALSGGERQRISLARAFLKDAPILILDEPTSSVDVQTEAKIMEAMQRLMAGRTAFMIAHRLTTLEGCDMRVQLVDGRVLDGPARGQRLESGPTDVTDYESGGSKWPPTRPA